MPLRTPHKRALVAGGTGRVGAAIAERLRAEGWRVCAAGSADGDLRTRAGAAALAVHALEELGGLDVVVHAAGDGFAPKPFAEVTEEDWDAAMDVTAKGTLFLAQAKLGQARSSGGAGGIFELTAREREAKRDAPSEQPREVLDLHQLGLVSNRDRAQAKASFPDLR